MTSDHPWRAYCTYWKLKMTDSMLTWSSVWHATSCRRFPTASNGSRRLIVFWRHLRATDGTPSPLLDRRPPRLHGFLSANIVKCPMRVWQRRSKERTVHKKRNRVRQTALIIRYEAATLKTYRPTAYSEYVLLLLLGHRHRRRGSRGGTCP